MKSVLTDTRICFIGDSFVNGIGDPEGLGWVEEFALRLEGRVMISLTTTLGYGGSSVNIRARWLGEVAVACPKAMTGGSCSPSVSMTPRSKTVRPV